MRLVSFCLVLFFFSSTFAADDPTRNCAHNQALEAEKEIGTPKNWDQIYRSYKRFSQCDDGAIAEGYSDAVTELLADHWSSFNRLLVLTNRSKDFKTFVMRHIDETVPADRLVKIAKNARSDCPPAGRNLCLSIATATEKQ